MSLTIDEAITRFEANAEQNERWASGGLNPEANAEYAAEHRQLAAWLRELKERRKAPEICYCKDCKAVHLDFCLRTLKPVKKEKDYCSWAERRTE